MAVGFVGSARLEAAIGSFGLGSRLVLLLLPCWLVVRGLRLHVGLGCLDGAGGVHWGVVIGVALLMPIAVLVEGRKRKVRY